MKINRYKIILGFIFTLFIAYLYYKTSNKQQRLRALEDPIVHDNYVVQLGVCLPNSYHLPPGTIPLVGACPEGTRDIGTDCWSDIQDWGQNFVMADGGTVPNYGSRYKGGCCTMAWEDPCNHLCNQPGEIDAGCFCRTVDCGPDRDYINGLCYVKCPGGWERQSLGCKVQCGAGLRDDGTHCWKDAYIAKSLAQRQYCSVGKVLQEGLCYDKCQEGWESDHGLCMAPVTTKFLESTITPLIPVQVVGKQLFTREALFEGTSTPPDPC